MSTQNGQSQRRSNSSTQQRVAYGKDVEIKSEGRAGLQGRTPSLDDVLNQIRGERERGDLHVTNSNMFGSHCLVA